MFQKPLPNVAFELALQIRKQERILYSFILSVLLKKSNIQEIIEECSKLIGLFKNKILMENVFKNLFNVLKEIFHLRFVKKSGYDDLIPMDWE